MKKKKLVISIVSHGQGQLVKSLLDDLQEMEFSFFQAVLVVLTINTPEEESFISGYSGNLLVLRNLRPLGYGANHNQGFALEKSDYFLVLNPDIRLQKLQIAELLECLVDGVALVAPAVHSPAGSVEDSCRRYPTILRLFRRVIFNKRESEYTFSVADLRECQRVDWVAGMFMLFDSRAYTELCGFDTKYYMYYEDADICWRANKSGLLVSYCPEHIIIHDAQRKTFKSLKHTKWHIRSSFRFLTGW